MFRTFKLAKKIESYFKNSLTIKPPKMGKYKRQYHSNNSHYRDYHSNNNHHRYNYYHSNNGHHRYNYHQHLKLSSTIWLFGLIPIGRYYQQSEPSTDFEMYKLTEENNFRFQFEPKQAFFCPYCQKLCFNPNIFLNLNEVDYRCAHCEKFFHVSPLHEGMKNFLITLVSPYSAPFLVYENFSRISDPEELWYEISRELMALILPKKIQKLEDILNAYAILEDFFKNKNLQFDSLEDFEDELIGYFYEGDDEAIKAYILSVLKKITLLKSTESNDN